MENQIIRCHEVIPTWQQSNISESSNYPSLPIAPTRSEVAQWEDQTLDGVTIAGFAIAGGGIVLENPPLAILGLGIALLAQIGKAINS